MGRELCGGTPRQHRGLGFRVGVPCASGTRKWGGVRAGPETPTRTAFHQEAALLGNSFPIIVPTAIRGARSENTQRPPTFRNHSLQSQILGLFSICNGKCLMRRASIKFPTFIYIGRFAQRQLSLGDCRSTQAFWITS